MAFRDLLLPEFDQEISHTRKMLERVPEGKSDWKPHENSMALGRLAAHVAELPGRAVETIQQDALGICPVGQTLPQANFMSSRKQLLELLDKSATPRAGRYRHSER